MDIFANFAGSLGDVLTPANLLAALGGGLIGTLVGALPGIGPLAGIALVIPMTFGLPSDTAIIMLAGIYYGSNYGGRITAILLGIPGDEAAIPTTFDGYPMAKKGRAGAALTVSALSSFVGGTLAVVAVMAFAPIISMVAIRFSSADFFAVTLVALLVLSRLTGASFSMSMLSTALGLVVATIGIDGTSGDRRFTFGSITLAQGIELVPVAIGLFGLVELLFLIQGMKDHRRPDPISLKETYPSRAEARRSIWPTLRGSLLGIVVGLIPGPAATTAAFGSYGIEKSLSKRRSEFGTGAIEGVAGPEAANNAASTSAFAPLLALGLPFSGVMALLLASLQITGVQPGPLLISQHPEIFWGVIVSMYVGNVLLVIFNVALISVWVKALRIAVPILVLAVLISSVVGTFATRTTMFDVWLLFLFGAIGFFLRRYGFPLAPMVLGVILGPMVEKYFRQALFESRGDVHVFVSSPTTIVVWVLGIAVVVGAAWAKRPRRGRTTEASTE